MKMGRRLMKLAKSVQNLCGRREPEYDSSTRHCSEGRSSERPPAGFLAVYVGDEQQRFAVPTSYLSHPLFRMLLQRAYEEYGFEQKSGLKIPCSVAIFQEVVSVVKCCHGQFHLEKLVDEFL